MYLPAKVCACGLRSHHAGRKEGSGSRFPEADWASCGVNCGGRSEESLGAGQLQSDRVDPLVQPEPGAAGEDQKDPVEP